MDHAIAHNLRSIAKPQFNAVPGFPDHGLLPGIVGLGKAALLELPAQIHQNPAQMVFALARAHIHTPVDVVPGIALDQLGIVRLEQRICKIWMLFKLGPNHPAHDVQLDHIPVGTDGDFAAQTLGFVR